MRQNLNPKIIPFILKKMNIKKFFNIKSVISEKIEKCKIKWNQKYDKYESLESIIIRDQELEPSDNCSSSSLSLVIGSY